MNKSYTLSIFFALLLFFQTKSQTQTWQWIRGSSGESLYRIKAGKTGNIFGMGNFNDTIRFDTITIAKNDLNYSGGTQNSFIVKYDGSGNLKWVKDIGEGNFFSYGFCVDSHDNCYISGIYYDDSCVIGNTVLHNPTHGYYQNLFLAKFDSAGNFFWVKQNLNNGSFWLSSVAIDASDNIYLYGDCTSADSISFDSIALQFPNQASSLFLAKFDPSGHAVWLRIAEAGGCLQGERTLDVATDGWGNVFITGSFSSWSLNFDSTMTIYNPHGCQWYSNLFIAKYDSTGRVLWAKSEGGNGQAEGWRINTDVAGNIYLSGNYSSATFDTISITGPGEFLSQFSPNGNLNWIKPIIYSGSIWSIGIDRFGYEYVTGQFQTDSIMLDSITLYNPVTIGYNICSYFAKYDHRGNVLWAKLNIGYFNDVDVFSNVFVAGSISADTMYLDSLVLITPPHTPYASFMAKLSSGITRISEVYSEKNQITIYPNPFHTSAILSSNTEQGNLKIYNTFGIVVREETIANHSAIINRKTLADGIYFYQLIGKNGQLITGKFAIE